MNLNLKYLQSILYLLLLKVFRTGAHLVTYLPFFISSSTTDESDLSDHGDLLENEGCNLNGEKECSDKDDLCGFIIVFTTESCRV